MHTGECLLEAQVNLCNISKWSTGFTAAFGFMIYYESAAPQCHSPSPLPGCDECIWHLIGDLRLSNKTLDQLKVGVLNISTGAAANDRIKYYNYTAHRLQVRLSPRDVHLH